MRINAKQSHSGEHLVAKKLFVILKYVQKCLEKKNDRIIYIFVYGEK